MKDVLQFEAWKSALRQSVTEDKLSAFNSIDDDTLSMFFNQGVKPQLDAIIEDSQVG